jgi:hypothetical protein
MNMPEIATLTRVPLREVWKHEALDFTKWLVDNISVVSEATGVELTNAESEHSVGAFSVDLIAETLSGDPVIIENQLEKSDHDHLGKVLTYLSNLDAKVAIWIVADPRPEHIGAVTWLNESGLASFFLLKIEAVMIGGSPPAPLLTLIVGPSAESSSIGAKKQELAHAEELRIDFWQGLLEEAKKLTSLHSSVTPQKYNWIAAGSGMSGITFNYVVTKHSSRVELYVDRGDADVNAKAFDAVAGKKDEIEAAFGAPLEWERLPGKRACRIKSSIDGGYLDHDHKSQTQHELAAVMARFEKAIKPALAAI